MNSLKIPGCFCHLKLSAQHWCGTTWNAEHLLSWLATLGPMEIFLHISAMALRQKVLYLSLWRFGAVLQLMWGTHCFRMQEEFEWQTHIGKWKEKLTYQIIFFKCKCSNYVHNEVSFPSSTEYLFSFFFSWFNLWVWS